MVSKLYLHVACLFLLVSSTNILAGNFRTAAKPTGHYKWLPQEIKVLPISYRPNSELGALLGGRVVDANESSADGKIKYCTVEQILDTNPYSPPRMPEPSSDKFTAQGLAVSLGIPCTVAALLNWRINATNKSESDKKAAKVTAAKAVAILAGGIALCAMICNFRDFNQEDIAHTTQRLMEADTSKPQEWLMKQTSPAKTGLDQLVNAQFRIRSLNVSVQLTGGSEMKALRLPTHIMQLIDSNRTNVERAARVLTTSEVGHRKIAQDYYAQINFCRVKGVAMGGFSAALSFYLAARSIGD